MKNPKTIFAHLFPNSKNFIEQRCFAKLLSLLPQSIKENTVYLFRKNETLYFVLKHPGFILEVNYNKKVIKDILTTLQKHRPECDLFKITQIKAFSKFVPPKKEEKRYRIVYKEKSKGTFTIESETFKDIFIKIKEAIKENGT